MTTISINSKVRSNIKYYVGTAAIIGINPIPCADTILLTGIQMKMMNDVMKTYNINIGIVRIFEEVIRAKITIMLCKVNLCNTMAMAGNVLKFIPGYGSVLGGIINAAAVSAITYEMGKRLVSAAEMINENGWKNDREKVYFALRMAI